MIRNIRLIRNVGAFDSDNGAANVNLSKLVLVYAENGRGKTTLTSILRSLATNETQFVDERARLGAQNPPHICFNADGQPSNVMFHNGAWTRNLPNIKIFDDFFVDTNVHSGLNVEPQHRQNLHELILGEQGVALNRRLENLVEANEEYITDLRQKAGEFPTAVLHGLGVDEFCDLAAVDDIDNQIGDAERTFAAAQNRDAVLSAESFEPASLPDFDTDSISNILERGLSDLDSAAEARVRGHIDQLGNGGENWVSDGVGFLPEGEANKCPFCGQNLESAAIIAHYRAYFSAEYEALKRDIESAIRAVHNTHLGAAQTELERNAGAIVERRLFWSRFADVNISNIETVAILDDWNNAITAVLKALLAKQNSPLERMELGTTAENAIGQHRDHKLAVDQVNREISIANTSIEALKESTEAADTTELSARLARLRAAKDRRSPEVDPLCVEYLRTRRLKEINDNDREDARINLQAYRDNVFPALQTNVNNYLPNFNAGFRVDRVAAANRRGGSYCTYDVVINNNSIPIANADPGLGNVSFRNTLSAGDRNTLALALFFASLDQVADLDKVIVVVDDPVSSLDDHRTAATVHRLGALKERAGQVIVLSHNKPFLCEVWDRFGHADCTTLQIVRGTTGSSIRGWDVSSDVATQHDERYGVLQGYLDSPVGTHPAREVAQSIRPHLEYYFRVVCPRQCPPGTRIGQFLDRCRQARNGSTPILEEDVYIELDSIVAYANGFHHDTNRDYLSTHINDQELHGFVGRTLRLTGPPRA